MTRIQLKSISNRGRQSGLTLIEVLIALLVLSIGLVGVAVLHLNSIKFAHSSYYSSIATSMALDLEERLWLAVAESDGECVSQAQANTIVGQVQNQWAGTASNSVVIPGLTVQPGTIFVGDADTPWTEVPISATWADGRMGQNFSEQFNYTARVICFESE